MQNSHPYGGYSAAPPPRGYPPYGGGAQQGNLPPSAGPSGAQTAPYGVTQSPVPAYGSAGPGPAPGYGASGSYQNNAPMSGPSGYSNAPAAGRPPYGQNNAYNTQAGGAGAQGGSGSYGRPPMGVGQVRPYGAGPASGSPQRPAYGGGFGGGAESSGPSGQYGQYGGGPGGPNPGPSYGSEDDFGGRKRPRMEEGAGGAGYDQSHEQFLKERLKRERPCRTLFVRNVDFRANMPELKAQFESFGEIKNFFDLVEKRGLAFITYFDLRPAEAAKMAMQGTRINGRELDVHYSLPREAETTKRCDRDKDQGTLFVVLKKAPDDLSDDELGNLFSQFGEVKNIRRYKDQNNCRFIEFWDSRGCKAAHDALIGSEYRGGTWDVKFAWDAAAPDRVADLPKDLRDREWARVGGQAGGPGQINPRGPFRANNAGGRPPYGQQGSPSTGANAYGPPQQGGYGPRPPAAGGYGQQARPPPPPSYGAGPAAGPPSYGTKRPYDYDDGSQGGPPTGAYGAPGGGANYGSQGSDQGYSAAGQYGNRPPPPGNGYGRPPPPMAGSSGPYASPSMGGAAGAAWRPPVPANAPPQHSPTPPTSGAGGDDRLEQAQRVQQMLASLKAGGGGASAGASAPAASSQGPQAQSPYGVTSSAAASNPGAAASPGNGNAAPAAKPGLPSSIAALLQMAQQQSAQKK